MVKRVLALLTVVVVAGCGFAGTPAPAPGRSGTTRPSADVVTKSLKDVERFWSAAYPKLAGGAPFRPVTGGYHPYTRRQLPPDCGGQPSEYQPNAFYCPDSDFIAWDAQTLIPQLQSDYGPLLVGVVFAHEYGHAIQSRLRMTEGRPTVVLEQQADCFAGAWLADTKAFGKVTPAQLDNTVAGVLMLRDQPGTSARTEGAHGNAFDRIRALQDGVEKGVAKCAAYDVDNLPVTEVPFQTSQDAATGGELDYGDAVQLLTADAQDYWSRTFPRLAGKAWPELGVRAFDPASPPACPAPDASAQGAAFYCPDGDFVAFDNGRLGPALYQRIGDNAVGMLLGDLFARAAQDRRGASTQDRAGQLAVDCLAGSWTNDILGRAQGSSRIQLSPGDLDEAVAALLAFGRATDGSGPSAFDRIAAYRTGVLDGLGGC